MTVTLGNFSTEWCYRGSSAIFQIFDVSGESGHFVTWFSECLVLAVILPKSKIIFKKTYKPAYNNFKNKIQLFINIIILIFSYYDEMSAITSFGLNWAQIIIAVIPTISIFKYPGVIAVKMLGLQGPKCRYYSHPTPVLVFFIKMNLSRPLNLAY